MVGAAFDNGAESNAAGVMEQPEFAAMRLRDGLACGEERGERMHLGFRGTALAFAITTVLIGSTAARAGDDGQAPLWSGIGSIFSGLGVNPFGGDDKPPPIDYREHGKIVVPPKIDLPPPSSPVATGGDWPVNVETQRKAAQKAAKKDIIAGQGDARLRYNHPFPNAPVEVRPTDQADPQLTCPHGSCEAATNSSSSSMLGSINPLNWVGMGSKSTALGPEPDREWLTDPPKGYRAPAAATGQATN